MEQQKSIVGLARSLGRVARVIEVLAWVVGIGGVFMGVLVALRSAETCRDVIGGECESAQHHPWIATGVGVVVLATVLGLILWTLGRLATVYSLDVLEPESRVDRVSR